MSLHAEDFPSMAEEWGAFEKLAVPPRLPLEHSRAMRNSFYAGGMIIIKAALAAGEIEDDAEAVDVLRRYYVEIAQYAAKVYADAAKQGNHDD